MFICYRIWTCPEWIFCTQKHNPFGDELHTVCCALSGILFVVELVEGKEHPCQAGPLEFEDLCGKNVWLLLHMMKSYFATGRHVIIDSGFCVLKGLVQLRKKGVFACAFIKKRRYWPAMVPSKEMEDRFRFSWGGGGGNRLRTTSSPFSFHLLTVSLHVSSAKSWPPVSIILIT